MTSYSPPFPEFYRSSPLIFAHRGANKLASENSLLAFEQAYSVGADGIELDVQLSADGALIVYHDSNLKRLTGVNKQVDSLPLQTLKSLTVDAQVDPSFQATQIATLDEVFDQFGQKLLFNIELKTIRHRRRELAERVAHCIHRHHLGSNTIVSSFDRRSLHFLRQQAPELHLGHLMVKPTLIPVPLPGWLALRHVGLEHAIHPNYRFVNQTFVARAHRANLRVNVWTVNSPDAIQQMLDHKVDMIITDDPALARKIVRAKTTANSQAPLTT